MGGRGSGSCKPIVYCLQVGGTLLKVVGNWQQNAFFYKGAFRQIAMLVEVHGFLTMLRYDLVFTKAGEGIYARAFATMTWAQLRTSFSLIETTSSISTN